MPQWLNKALGIGAAFAVAVACFFAIRWLSSEPTEFHREDIEVAWGDAIGQFKIEPVFPPEEDVAVGDVLAYVIGDTINPTRAIDRRTPSVKRSVKIAHVDVRDELEKTYAELAVFPGVLKAPVNEAPKAGQDASPPPAVGRLFKNGPVLENDLPRAAFARLKGSFSATAGGALTANDQAQANFGGSSQGTEEFHLTEVSTYGLPAARALKMLNEYCKKDDTKGDCNEETYRQYLWPILGNRIYVKNLGLDGKDVYAVDIRLVIVNRVYLARSIVHRRLTGRSEGGGFFAGLFSGGKGGSEPPPQEQPPLPNASTVPTDETLRKQIEDLQKQVSRMQQGGGFETSGWAYSGSQL